MSQEWQTHSLSQDSSESQGELSLSQEFQEAEEAARSAQVEASVLLFCRERARPAAPPFGAKPAAVLFEIGASSSGPHELRSDAFHPDARVVRLPLGEAPGLGQLGLRQVSWCVCKGGRGDSLCPAPLPSVTVWWWGRAAD